MKTKRHNRILSLAGGGTTQARNRGGLVAFVVALLLSLCLPTAQGQAGNGVSAGLLKVEQMEFGVVSNTNVTVAPLITINGFRPIMADTWAATGQPCWNSGDYYVQIGDAAADDITNGVLISSVAQNGRTNWTLTSTNSPFAHSFIEASSLYRICSHASFWSNNAGSAVYAYGRTTEYNVNVAGAWFPYDRYLGGHARNSNGRNGGSNDLFTASPQLVFNTHFLHLGISNELSTTGAFLTNGGISMVDLRSLGINSQTDGILLVNHGKDEGNFALSKANEDGTWTLYVHDGGTDSASGYEQDPIAFVYVPRTDTSLISGRFNGDASIAIYSGPAPQFTVERVKVGQWLLKMKNYAATNGVLIISPEGGGGYNLDNIVNYEMTPDGMGWLIESRDAPVNGRQDVYRIADGVVYTEPAVSFAFVPAPAVGFVLSPAANVLTSEAGTTGSFGVALNAKPSADVTITVASGDTTEGTVDVSSLTFTPENWWQYQTVTVTGQDDAETDGQVAYSIVLSGSTSADLRFNGLDPADVGAINADNEAGVSISANSLTTSEGGATATFQVVLNTAPIADVAIGFTSSDTTEGAVSPASLTFTAGDWAIPQIVTVTGVNDALVDGNVAYTVITAAATSADPAFEGINGLDVALVNLDNDGPGITFSPATGVTVSEPGSTASFSVALTAQPAANVTVSFTSSDPSEGSVSPASRTFTAANWATPQSFTLTAVDDTEDDGPITYALNATLSGDPVFAAFTARPFSATTLDSEPALKLSSPTVIYGIGWPGMSVDGQATITDTNAVDYNAGSLTVTLTANGTGDDRLEIRNTGTDVEQIGVSGTSVTYGGVTIGTFSGGTGTTPLVVSFNASATPAAAQALLRNVTFRSVSAEPSLVTRTVRFDLANGDGGTATASKQILVSVVHVCDFQEGKDGGFGVYTGAKDCEVWVTQYSTPVPMGSRAGGGIVLANRTTEEIPREGLLRFENIVGTSPGQIPPGSTVIEADLMLNIIDTGVGSPLHRVLVDWDADSATYENTSEGIQLDDVEAKSTFDSQICNVGNSGTTQVGNLWVGVLPDVQAWVDGEPNFGWVMPSWVGNNNATAFSPCEHTNVTFRPRLVVKWIPSDLSGASFQQGTNDYAGAVDTRIRQIVPDQEFSTINTVYTDFEVTGGMEDAEHALFRFGDIIGTGVGQVPPGARVHAAVLHLYSRGGAGPGDGGTFHRMLIPWEGTNTWNDLVEGVQADGVEAAATASATVGNITLTPNAASGNETFDVTADVQLWANGVPNYGWALLPWPYGGDGWGIATAEYGTESARPKLVVYYTPVTPIVMLPPVVGATSVEVKFTAEVGKTYSVQRVAALDGTWATLGTATVQSNGVGTYTDMVPLTERAFYRVVSP